ncbi:ABC transporter permease [Methylocapsa aurea]|uniref:ABC transporter permease n=1 Tax=Methylocapsa aurea TaxID=663610 RepID=UPI00055F23C9|nr:ABC transporter permease [Methylocapsa aurea]
MDAKEMTEARRRPAASALAINLAVINAIVLRDIRVRSGPYYTGFLMILLMPLAHLVALLTIYHIFKRLAPVGNDQIVYFGLSILPFVIFLYLSRRIVIALQENRPLLFFNRVKVFDIIFARGVLEAVSCVIVFIFVIFILDIFSDGFKPRDWAGILFALFAAIYFGFSFGVINSLIAQIFPFWATVYNLTMPLMWVSSGVIFFPSNIPEPYNYWIALNPLLQCVEWIRYSYYENYPDRILNVSYLLSFSTACLAFGLIGERLSRRIR